MEFTLPQFFSSITDPRIDRCKRHTVEDIIALTVIAVICGAEGWESIEEFGKSKEEFLKTILQLPNGIPSHDTIERLFKRLDSTQFEKNFREWANHIKGEGAVHHIGIDGKTVRGSRDENNGKHAIHMVSAWSYEHQLILGQLKTEKKCNEIEAIKQLIDLLSIEKSTITIDAMGCQKEIAEKIIGKNADYILAVKDNQGSLAEEVTALLKSRTPNDQYTSIEKDHGRIETRTCKIINELEWLDGQGDWPGLKTIVCVQADRQWTDHHSTETRYYISSKNQSAKEFNADIRNHWSIENQLHWVLDVQFREDESRKRADHAAENFAIARRIAFTYLKKTKLKRMGIHNKQLKAAWDIDFLLSILKN